jgi:hypothetical protein
VRERLCQRHSECGGMKGDKGMTKGMKSDLSLRLVHQVVGPVSTAQRESYTELLLTLAYVPDS